MAPNKALQKRGFASARELRDRAMTTEPGSEATDAKTLEEMYRPSAVFCITLADMPQKWDAAVQRLGRDFPSLKPFAAVDARKTPWADLPVDVATKFYRKMEKDRKYHHEFGAGGAVGCMLSHIGVLKHIVAQNIPDAIVFEDDARILGNRDTFARVAKMLRSHRDKWDMFMFGYRRTMVPFKNLPPPMNECLRGLNGPFFGLHAYWVTNRGASFLLEKLEFPLTAQMDSWVGFLAHLHPEFRLVCSYDQDLIAPKVDTVVGSTTQTKAYDCNLCDVEASSLESKRERKRLAYWMGFFLLTAAFGVMAGVAMCMTLSGTPGRTRPSSANNGKSP